MRLRQVTVVGLLVGAFCVPAHAEARDIGRDTLAADDGWAAYGTGTTGGAAADDDHVYTVTNRAELVRALDNGSATPKIIKIAGTVDANTDDDGDHLDCADYATDGYDLKKYLAAYDPRTWGSARPSGPQEEARQASAAQQAERVVLTVGSNTTIVGLGKGAVLKGGSLQVRNADNVILRNLDLRDAYDCFPVWQPNTGGLGDWKTAYDNVWLTGATHVWVDQVTASVMRTSDRHFILQGGWAGHFVLGAPKEQAPGASIGLSHHRDGGSTAGRAESDACGGPCKTDLRGDWPGPAKQEPMVVPHSGTDRNLQPQGWGGRQSLGVSTERAFYAEGCILAKPSRVEVADLVKSWNGTALHQSGTLFNGWPVDLLAIHNAYNSGSERDLTADVGWTPTLHGKIDSAAVADREVARGAGAGRIP
ncbi:pectate lyase [Streptomyces sp. NPDC096132]|uniref:pectate lyase family protein n=1 Tax=Streptomyces sp. NPDC096132 TaxID=3366075 RepID=UPI00382ED8B8